MQQEAAIRRYRVLALVVGVMLLLVCFVGFPLRQFGGYGTPSAIISPIHGVLYIVYLAVAFDLQSKLGWPMKKFLVMASAGLVPFLAFWIERRIVREARQTLAARSTEVPGGVMLD